MALHESYKNSKNEEIDLSVLVFTRPNLRGSLTEMTMYQGKQILDNLFDTLIVDSKTTDVYIEYPERWTNIIEQRAIISRIPILYPNVKQIVIKTHSVYIIQCTNSVQVRICDAPARSQYPDKDYGDLSVKFAPPPNELLGLWHATPDSQLTQLTKY